MIAICPNPFRDTDLIVTGHVVELLENAGMVSVVFPLFTEGESLSFPQDLPISSLREQSGACTLAIVIGGDGTMLSAIRELHEAGVHIPLLGINLGSKGFMTALEPNELDQIVPVVRGNYEPSRRMMLDVILQRDGETIYSDFALNDAVLHGYGECVKLTAWCNGQRMTGFTGDGVILSTPTGSTGYSLSAGGPIVEPDAENIILSPICAHVMGSRTFVLDPERRITVKTELPHGRRAYLSVDGGPGIDLRDGDLLEVCKSEHYTVMADPGLRSFYETAYEKLR